MPRVFNNAVPSVSKPPTLLILASEAHTGWCDQFSQEGYNVVHVAYPPTANEPFKASLQAAEKAILELGVDWALISYGLSHHDAGTLLQVLALCLADIKAVVHYSPTSKVSKGFLAKDSEGRIIPTVFHLTSTQEDLHASLLPLTDPSALGYQLPTSSYPPVTVHVYPKVTLSAFLSTPPAFATADDSEPFIRSAKSLSLTRTLEILKRHIGPHFDFGKLWEKHSYYEFVERDALKTMSTMVASPYVNHVASMTGTVTPCPSAV